MERISSRQNAIVKRFRELARASAATTSGEVLLDGEHLVQEALATRHPDRGRGLRRTHLANAHSPLARTRATTSSRAAAASSPSPIRCSPR